MVVTQRTRKLYSFWIDPGQATALKDLKGRDGVPESETIRRALDAWLKEKGVTVKAERKRAVTRRRP